LDFDNRMNMYSDDRLPRRWMLAHPIGIARSNFFLSFFFCSSTAKKSFHSSKWGSIPRYPLAQRDEGRDVLNHVGIQMLQLKLVVVQQPLEESVGRSREPTLVEGDEGDDVAIGR